MKRQEILFAEMMIGFALDKLAECDNHVLTAYNATNADPEDTGVAMFLTPEFEIAAQRMGKLKSELDAIRKILREALDK